MPRRELFNGTPTGLGLYVTVADLIADTVPQVPAAVSPSGICYQGGIHLWSGAEVSYRTGDEKDAYDNGLFTFTRPAYPTSYAELASGSWDTLTANNVHGNTSRFTARDGAAAATSGDRIIQDHLTGYEFYVAGSGSNVTWDAAIDAGVALNGTLGETGWYLCPLRIQQMLARCVAVLTLGTGWNYSPFSNPLGSGNTWSSTTRDAATTQALYQIGSQYIYQAGNKVSGTSATARIFVRRFAA